jgi:hypothetical protein
MNGDGQCYGDYQIHCRFADLTRVHIVGSEVVGIDDESIYNRYTLQDCLYYCKAIGRPFAALALDEYAEFIHGGIIVGYYGECTCLGEVTDAHQSDARSMSYCPRGVDTPPPPCCVPYLGDLNRICKGDGTRPDNHGDGQCLPGGYRVSSATLFAHIKSHQLIDCRSNVVSQHME